MDYNNYDAEDFVQDEYFQKWVTSTDASVDAFWQTWLRENPEKEPLVLEARRIISLLKFGTEPRTNERFIQVWQQLDAQWEQQELQTEKTTPAFLLRNWQKMAAVFIGFLLIGMGILYVRHLNVPVRYATQYGETRVIQLPDLSTVTLNANSVLTVSSGWNNGKIREVSLSGEAFFEVQKKSVAGKAVKFVVYTDQVKVEVLGTKFNVNHRRKKTQVVLNSGKIRLNTITSGNTNELILKPGDLAEFSVASKSLTIKKVNPKLYSSWKSNTLIFESTPVSEIIQTLEDTYGLKIIVENQSVLNKKYTGTFYQANSEIILQSISTLFGLQTVREQGKIILKDTKD